MSLWTEVITGRSAVVNGVSTMGKVQLKRFVPSSPIHASNMQGGADRAAGNLNFQGIIAAWGHTPTTFVNETFNLTFTLDGSNKTTCTNAMCTGLDIFVPTYDPKAQNCIYYHQYFGPVGEDLVDSAGSAPTDTSNVAKFSVKGLGLLLDSVPQGHIDSMQLSIRALAEAKPDSSTNGIYVTPLGDVDWTFVYRQNIYALSQLPARNSTPEVWMQVVSSPVAYWKLKYGLVIDHSIDVDHDSPDIISAEVTLGKCGKSGDVGSIIDPAGVTQWP